MSRNPVAWASAIALVLGLGGCEVPPPGAYYEATASTQSVPIGDNTTGESLRAAGQPWRRR